MAHRWRRPAAAVALSFGALLASAAPAASRAPDPEGTTVTALSVSGPVESTAGHSGHPQTAPPPARPEAAPSADPRDIPLGAESVIGPDGRERVTTTTTYPNSAVGQLELTNSGLDWLCTGFLIDDDSVLTSGHCAYDIDPENGTLPNLIESATFTPGRNQGSDPFGSCDVESAWAPTEFSVDGLLAYDFAVLNLSADCDAIGTQTGTYGLFARSGSLAQVKANVQGYPGDFQTTAVFGTQKRAHGKIVRSQKRLVFYPMDTTGGQSGAPVWRQRVAGDCVGPCAMAVHGYGTDPKSTGIWFDNNAGIRLTPFRIGQILDVAAQND